jgi:hypothetical protein
MRHTFLGLMVLAALVPACADRESDPREARQEAALEQADRMSGEDVVVTGCLTGNPETNAFVVTAPRNELVSGALYSREGEVPTYTYELVGNAADLAQHIGREVEVHGRLAGRDDEVDVEQEDKATLEPRRSGEEVVTPHIETETQAEIKVQRLEVSTITPTGQPCRTARQ